jgi:ribonuclease BN (tRNA processing enzyme)
LRARLTKYLSTPLFPVHLRELPSRLTLHDTPLGRFEIESILVTADLVLHPGITVGYRLSEKGSTLAYLSDHEPALATAALPESASWTSGYALAEEADVLIHDSQYTDAEYESHRGWGHSSMRQSIEFAQRAKTRKLVTFHHDPAHSDLELDAMHNGFGQGLDLGFDLIPGREGLSLHI